MFQLAWLFQESGGAMDVDFGPSKRQKSQKKSKKVIYMNSNLFEAWIVVIWVQDFVLAQVWQITQRLWLCNGR